MVDWTRVQGTSTTVGSGTSNSLSFAGAVGNGNVVRGGVLLATGSAVTSVTDDKNNAYRVTSQGDDGNQLYAALFRSLHLVTNAPTTITVNCSPTSATFWIVLDEFAPPTGTTDISLDGFGRILQTNTALATNNFGTWRSDALIYSVCFSNGTATTGAGFTAGQGSGTGICTEWKIQAAAASGLNGAYATQTGTGWILADAIVPQAALWEPIQHALQRSTVNALTGNVSLHNAVANNSIVIGSIAVDNLSNLTSLQDDKGNNYTVLTPNSNGRAIFWSAGLITNGPTTITATVSAQSATVFLMANEIVPPPGTISVAVDGTPVNTFILNTSGSSTTSPNVTTSNANDLAYSVNDTGNTNSLPTTGYSQFSGVFPDATTWSDAYALLLTAGTYNTTWSYLANASNENIFLVAIKATLASPSVTSPGSIVRYLGWYAA